MVHNHETGADDSEVVTAYKRERKNRVQKIGEPYKIKANTKFAFRGRSDKLSSFKWNSHCLTEASRDENKQEDGIYKTVNEYGEKWGEFLGEEKENFDHLMASDIEFGKGV